MADNPLTQMREALELIARYGVDGICPYGCDAPSIAKNALEKNSGDYVTVNRDRLDELMREYHRKCGFKSFELITMARNKLAYLEGSDDGT